MAQLNCIKKRESFTDPTIEWAKLLHNPKIKGGMCLGVIVYTDRPGKHIWFSTIKRGKRYINNL